MHQILCNLAFIVVLGLSSSLGVYGETDFYNMNGIFLYNNVDNCKDNEYFDSYSIKCRHCDETLNLVPSSDRKF